MPLFIREYERLGEDMYGRLAPAGIEPAIASHQVATGAVSTQSNALNARTKFIRVTADVDCFVEFGVNPTASTNSMRLVANAIEFLALDPNVHRGGTQLKIAVRT